MAWDNNKNVPKDSRDLFHRSTQHSTQDLMTKGISSCNYFLLGPTRATLQPPLLSPIEEKIHKGGCLWPGYLQLVRMRTMISFSSGPARKIILHCWVGWGKNFLPMSQITPTRNLLECKFTVIHFNQAARVLKTQKYEAMALERRRGC